MTEVVTEVENAIESLGLSKDVIRLPDSETEKIYKELLSTFVEGGDRRWWWESFKMPSKSITFKDDKGFKQIPKYVPDYKEILWFVVEDDHSPYYPIYEASAENASKIIGECFGFEYYLVPKNKKWLLCENHHGRVIGIGDEIIMAIEKEGM